jgi:hypothetical protein
MHNNDPNVKRCDGEGGQPLDGSGGDGHHQAVVSSPSSAANNMLVNDCYLPLM